MDYEKRWRELLLPSVRVVGDAARGSGTVIYSKNGPDGASTYVLSNFHVVSELVKIDKKWSTLLKRYTTIDVFGVPKVEFFEYRWQARTIGSTAIECDIVAYDKDEDMALLHLRSPNSPPAVAKLSAKGSEPSLRLTMPVYTVGAAMGDEPVITYGMLAMFGREIDNREYWAATSPSIYGNSGGATFLADTHEMLGVPSRLAVTHNGSPITHLCYIIPFTRIYTFLDDQMFRFIYDSRFTEEGEAEARRRRRTDDEKRTAAVEERGEKPPEDYP